MPQIEIDGNKITAAEPLENPITEAEIDMHPWYAVVIVTFMSGERVVRVIGNADGSGLCAFDSVAEFQAAL